MGSYNPNPYPNSDRQALTEGLLELPLTAHNERAALKSELDEVNAAIVGLRCECLERHTAYLRGSIEDIENINQIINTNPNPNPYH